MRKFKEAGLSLIEGIVSIGLFSVIGLGIMKLSGTNMNQQSVARSKDELISTIIFVRTLLSDPETCRVSFKSVNINSSQLQNIKDKEGIPAMEVGKTYEGLRLDSIRIKEPGAADGRYKDKQNRGFTDVRLDFSKNGKSYPKQFRLWIETDASDNIQKCSSVYNPINNLWSRSYDNPDNIFYATGTVAAGQEPSGEQLALETPGVLTLTTSSNDKLRLGGRSNDRVGLEFSSNKKLKLENTITGVGADIVINDALINEFLVINKTHGQPCNSQFEGSVRYNININKLQYCGGFDLKWRSFKDE